MIYLDFSAMSSYYWAWKQLIHRKLQDDVAKEKLNIPLLNHRCVHKTSKNVVIRLTNHIKLVLRVTLNVVSSYKLPFDADICRSNFAKS